MPVMELFKWAVNYFFVENCDSVSPVIFSHYLVITALHLITSSLISTSKEIAVVNVPLKFVYL